MPLVLQKMMSPELQRRWDNSGTGKFSDIPEGKWQNKIFCPWCDGGQKQERNFRFCRQEGWIRFKCFRMNNCGSRGSMRESFSDDEEESPAADEEALDPYEPRKMTETTCVVALSEDQDDPLDGAERSYLEDVRKIDSDVLDANKVCQRKTHMDKELKTLIFPYYAGGLRVAEKWRTMSKQFKMNPGSHKCVYGVDHIIGANRIVIVEGEIDKLSVETAGIKECVSVQNGAANGVDMTYGADKAFKEAKRIVIAVDGDRAGNKLRDEIVQKFGWQKCLFVEWPEGKKDANDVLCDPAFGKEGLKKLIDEAKPRIPAGTIQDKDILMKKLHERLNADPNEERYVGFTTGWGKLDEFYRPVPGEFTVLTGKPGCGKSEFLLSLVINMAENGKRTLIFAFESSERSLHTQLAEKKLQTKLTPKIKDEDDVPESTSTAFADNLSLSQATSWLDKQIVLGTNDATNEVINLDYIMQIAKSEKDSEEGLDFIIIDPYNYIDRGKNVGERPGQMSETEFVSKMLSQLKRFAYENDVHILMVAHPTKNNGWANPEKPELYDIAGSANWFNKCDVGIVICRKKETKKKKPRAKSFRKFTDDDDEDEDEDEDEKPVDSNILEIDIQKMRTSTAGKLGICDLIFDRETRGFYENARDIPAKKTVDTREIGDWDMSMLEDAVMLRAGETQS